VEARSVHTQAADGDGSTFRVASLGTGGVFMAGCALVTMGAAARVYRGNRRPEEERPLVGVDAYTTQV
jgi:hypothetical protein